MSVPSQEENVQHHHLRRRANRFDSDNEDETEQENLRVRAKEAKLELISSAPSTAPSSAPNTSPVKSKKRPFAPNLLRSQKGSQEQGSQEQGSQEQGSQELFLSQPTKSSQSRDDDEDEEEKKEEEEEDDDGESIGFTDPEDVDSDEEEDVPNQEDIDFVVNDEDVEEDAGPGGMPLQHRIANGEYIIPAGLEKPQKELLQYLVMRKDPVQTWRMQRQKSSHIVPLPEDRVVNNYHTVLLGPGGSGKTYNIMWLIDWLTQHKIPFMVTGTTGNAANVFNMHLLEQNGKEDSAIPNIENVADCQAKTMHSALSLGLLVGASIEVTRCHKALKTATAETRLGAETNLKRAMIKLNSVGDSILKSNSVTQLKDYFQGQGVIIIDEASMLEEQTLIFLDKLISRLTVYGTAPSLLLVGDFYQLTPVSGTPIYETKIMKKMFGTRVITLENVRRSENDPTLTAHNKRIRCGQFTPDTLAYLLSRDHDTTEDLPAGCENCVVIAPKHIVCDIINTSQHKDCLDVGAEEKQLLPWANLESQYHQQYTKQRGAVNIYYTRALERALRNLDEFKNNLCVGERVILCANMKTIGMPTGATGTIVQFYKNNDVLVQFDGHDRPKRVSKCKINETSFFEGKKIITEVCYIPLKPGRAVTVNAIEGQTIKNVPVVVFCSYPNETTGDYEDVLFGDTIRQLYVATSRVCETRQLHLIGFSKLDHQRHFSEAAANRSFAALREWENWVSELKTQFNNRDCEREDAEARAQQEEHDAAQQHLMNVTKQNQRPMPVFNKFPSIASMFHVLREKGVVCPELPSSKRRRNGDGDG